MQLGCSAKTSIAVAELARNGRGLSQMTDTYKAAVRVWMLPTRHTAKKLNPNRPCRNQTLRLCCRRAGRPGHAHQA